MENWRIVSRVIYNFPIHVTSKPQNKTVEIYIPTNVHFQKIYIFWSANSKI